MRIRNHDRVRRQIELVLLWERAEAHRRDVARREAWAIVRELDEGRAQGEAVERFLRAIGPWEGFYGGPGEQPTTPEEQTA